MCRCVELNKIFSLLLLVVGAAAALFPTMTFTCTFGQRWIAHYGHVAVDNLFNELQLCIYIHFIYILTYVLCNSWVRQSASWYAKQNVKPCGYHENSKFCFEFAVFVVLYIYIYLYVHKNLTFLLHKVLL